MVKGILICIVLLLAISGLCDVVHSVRSWMISAKRPRYNISIIVLKQETAYSQLKFITEQYRWYGTDFAENIIAVTDELHQEQIENFEKIFDSFIFCPCSAIENVMRSLMKGK